MPNAIRTAAPCLKHLHQKRTPRITSSELNNGMNRGHMPTAIIGIEFNNGMKTGPMPQCQNDIKFHCGTKNGPMPECRRKFTEDDPMHMQTIYYLRSCKD